MSPNPHYSKQIKATVNMTKSYNEKNSVQLKYKFKGSFIHGGYKTSVNCHRIGFY